MKVPPLIILIVGVSLFCFSNENVITLESANGSRISGSVTPGRTANTINLRRNDGKLFPNFPISSFSADSQKKIADALAAYEKSIGNANITDESELKISFQRQKADNNNDYGDIDDRVVKIQPRVIVESDERKKVYQKIPGEVIIIGKEAVSKDRWVILNRQKFSFARIEPDQRVSWEGKSFECRYDPDYAGFDYEGYLIVLKNKAGEVGMVKGSTSRWEELRESLLIARPGQGYDRTFSKKLSLRSTFGLPSSR